MHRNVPNDWGELEINIELFKGNCDKQCLAFQLQIYKFIIQFMI